MNIDPIGAPRPPRPPSTSDPNSDGRYRHLSTTLKMAIATTSPSNIGGLEAIARSLSSAAKELSHASGFAQQGHNATRNAQETLRAMRTVAQEAAMTDVKAEDKAGLNRQLHGLRQTVSRISSTTFAGQPVLSADPIRVQVSSPELSTPVDIEVRTSPQARQALQDFANQGVPDVASIDAVIEATDTLAREFDTATRRIEGSRAIVSEQRIAIIEAARESTERVDVARATETATRELAQNSARAIEVHEIPDSSAVLELLEGSEN